MTVNNVHKYKTVAIFTEDYDKLMALGLKEAQPVLTARTTAQLVKKLLEEKNHD
jgi:hypothetical protein